jgi:hypothetical protein
MIKATMTPEEQDVSWLLKHWPQIDVDPPFQRESNVWTKARKQLLIATILQGYDVPKIYLFEPRQSDAQGRRYQVVDGRQRLEAIHGFINGAFVLDDTIDDLKGKRFGELPIRGPFSQDDFVRRKLSFVIIRAASPISADGHADSGDSPDIVDVVEDYFGRLNEQSPLSAAEKRRSYGGAFVEAAEQLALHRVFSEIVSLSYRRSRRRHEDLAAKLLALEEAGGPRSVKRDDLDALAKKSRKERLGNSHWQGILAKAETRCGNIHAALASIPECDRKFQVGLWPVLYVVSMCASNDTDWSRFGLAWSDFLGARRDAAVRRENGEADNDNRSAREFENFDALVQTPNDRFAIDERSQFLLAYCRDYGVNLPGDIHRQQRLRMAT